MSELSSLPDVRTRAHAVAAALRRDILEGRIVGGARLRQTQIAERFGVSTTPVREAFALLRDDGLVQIDTHRGAVVVTLSHETLRESFDILIALEGLAAELAANSITSAELAELERILGEMRSTDDYVHHAQLTREFHEIFVRAARRPQLLSITLAMYASAAIYHTLAAEHSRDSRHSTEEQQRIYDALRAHEPRLAAAAAVAHLRRQAEFLTRLLPDEDRSS